MRLYERRGYRVIVTFTVGDGVPVYWMRRDTQSATDVRDWSGAA